MTVCLCFCSALVEHNPGAVKLSTDDYFSCHGGYQFDPGALGEAHMWNQNRGKHTNKLPSLQPLQTVAPL